MRGFRRTVWRCGAFITMLWLLAAAALAEPTVYGKTLLQTHDLPPEAVERFVRFNASKAKPVPGTILPDTEDWQGTQFRAPSSGNPYTVVVRTVGTAQADGQSGVRWLSGWSIAGATRTSFPIRVFKDGVKAGDRVEIYSSSGPVSFKEDRDVAPVAGFAGAENLKVERITVEVWSGVGKSSGIQLIYAWAPLLTGVIFLALFIWWRRS